VNFLSADLGGGDWFEDRQKSVGIEPLRLDRQETMPEARRNRRGRILIPLGIAALTAATAGALYWYFTPRNDPVTTEKTTRRDPPQKRKSVVIVLTQVVP
jgi:hypothetical protein